jgi:glycosyltransferase involved in cell wall biosynthesis
MMEAMACGLAVVATRVGGSAALLGPHAGWLVEPGDVAGLAERLARLLSDAGLRTALGAALAARMRAEFAIDISAGHYEICYRLLAAGQRERLAAAAQPGELLRDGSPWRS